MLDNELLGGFLAGSAVVGLHEGRSKVGLRREVGGQGLKCFAETTIGRRPESLGWNLHF